MKYLFIVLGSLSLVLGVLGIFLPVLPTTPFLLLSATLYMHSSPRLYRWLLENRYLGSYIIDYREHKSLALSTKVKILVVLWASMIYSILWACRGVLWVQILLGVIAVSVTWHILSLKTKVREKIE